MGQPNTSTQQTGRAATACRHCGAVVSVLLVIQLALVQLPVAHGTRLTDARAQQRATLWGPKSLLAKRALLSSPVLQPDYSVYFHKETLLKKVEEIVQANPNSMKMHVRSAVDGTYNVSMQVVDVEPGGFTGDDEAAGKARILMDFGEHAREYVSSELGIRLLQHLADPERLVRPLMGGGERADKLLQQLKRVVFKILPLENERGRDLVEGGKLCERKNGRGVDPNRNWEVDWGKKEADYDPQEEYPGTKPFSEPESQIVKNIAETFKPHVWVNVHSGMEAMFTPWDHIGEVADQAKDALRILQTIKQDFFTDNCVVGSGGKSVGYLAHGTATDYMYAKLQVPMPYTWEIYGDFKAAYNDCFRMFNPVDGPQLDSVLTLWLKATFRLIELIPTHPVVAKQVDLAPWTGKRTPATTPAGADQQKQQLKPGGGDAGTPSAAATGGGDKGPSTSPGKKSEDGSVLVVTPVHEQEGDASTAWWQVVVGVASVGLVAGLVYRSKFFQRMADPQGQHKPVSSSDRV